MVQFASEPTVSVDQSRATVTLRLADNSTDSVWRALFNELAKDSPVDAEAMGSRSEDIDRTVIVLRLDKGTDAQDVDSALDAVHGIAKRADAGLYDRRHAGDQVRYAADAWWRRMSRQF
ncbi:MAG: hypothetical protein ACLQPH_11960 [Acidimicrobiales bacterium]